MKNTQANEISKTNCGREMTFEQAYHFVYDLAMEKDTLGDVGIMRVLGRLSRYAKEAKANGLEKRTEYILIEEDDEFVLKRVKREENKA